MEEQAEGTIGPDAPGGVYTIGHSNHTLEVFVGLLQSHHIEVLIDTRSSPFSRYAPHFNRDSVKAAAQGAGIKYGFFGRHLGGRPDDEDYYDEDGRVVYSMVARSFLFTEGVERLMEGLLKYRTAIFCSEENPSVCHRRLLVGRVLFEQGVAVRHIRGSGAVQDEEELRRQEDAEKSSQQSLFGEEVVTEWKSILSVLPRARLQTSSDD